MGRRSRSVFDEEGGRSMVGPRSKDAKRPAICTERGLDPTELRIAGISTVGAIGGEVNPPSPDQGRRCTAALDADATSAELCDGVSTACLDQSGPCAPSPLVTSSRRLARLMSDPLVPSDRTFAAAVATS